MWPDRLSVWRHLGQRLCVLLPHPARNPQPRAGPATVVEASPPPASGPSFVSYSSTLLELSRGSADPRGRAPSHETVTTSNASCKWGLQAAHTSANYKPGSSHDPFSFDNLLECPPEPRKALKPIVWFTVKDADEQPDGKGYSVRSGRALGDRSSCPHCLAGTPSPKALQASRSLSSRPRDYQSHPWSLATELHLQSPPLLVGLEGPTL